MPWAFIVIGVLVQVVVWRLVARDRLPFWPAVRRRSPCSGSGRSSPVIRAAAVRRRRRRPQRSEWSSICRRDTTSSADPWRRWIGVRRRWAPGPSRSSRSRSSFRGRSCSGEVSSCPSSARPLLSPWVRCSHGPPGWPLTPRGEHPAARRCGGRRGSLEGVGDVERRGRGSRREPSRLDRAHARVAPSSGA